MPCCCCCTLARLNNQFVEFAKEISKLIIRDLAKPPREKCIQPLREQKGQAGGRKYVVGKVFFKFATDDLGLYDHEEGAQKAAGNELRAINAIVDCNIEKIHVTLTALFHIRGHRIMAVAQCPIDGSQTLVYGSDDLGKTVWNKDEGLSSLMKNLAEMMNLKAALDGNEVEFKPFIAGVIARLEDSEISGEISEISTERLFWNQVLAAVVPYIIKSFLRF